MKLNYITTQGSQAEQPAVLDVTSSAAKVYLRKNIQQITQTDSFGNKVTLWPYDEAILSREEYETYQEEIGAPSIELVMQNIEAVTLDSTEAQLDAQAEREKLGQQMSDMELTLLESIASTSSTTTTK